MKKKTALSRRTLLRGMVAGAGAGAAALALPPLDAMFNDNGTAYADGGVIPLRHAFFFWGGGMRPDRWKPGVTGRGWWEDPGDSLAPLAESTLVRDYVSVLSDFDCQQGGIGHHSGRAQMVSGGYGSNPTHYEGLGPTGPSLDYIVADAFEGQAPFRSMDLGVSEYGYLGRAGNSVSRNNDGNATDIEFSPRRIFDRMFGMGVDTDPEAAARVANVRRSMVDAVRESANRLHRRLGTTDQLRLDSHLDAIRGIERSIEGLEVASCALPDAPGEGYSDDLNHELLEEKNRVMADMLAMAFACDLTRCSAYQFTQMQSNCVFWQVGDSVGHHTMTHDDRGLGLEPQFERIHQATLFIMDNFRYLLEALASIPEGEQNVLYNSAIFATSEHSDATAHSTDEMPILIAGRAGGALVPGTHHNAPGTNTSTAHLTVLHALGIEAAGFGDDSARATSPVSALLA